MKSDYRIGEFGTFDVENYGDLLYPIVFERMLRQRGWVRETRKFSFSGSKSLRGSGYSTRPVEELFSLGGQELDALVIGGGDLLRTDWDRVASHYEFSGGGWRSRGMPFGLGTLLRGRPAGVTGEFRRRYMDYPGAGPFIIDPGDFSNVKSIVHCSCGVPFPFEEGVKGHVADCMDKSSFIHVRDQQSMEALIDAGVKRSIEVGPDLIVVLSDFFDPVEQRLRGRELLRRKGVEIGRPVVCVQTNPQPTERTIELIRQLSAYRERSRCEVILLPLGRCHGDAVYLKKLARDAGGAFRYVESESIFDDMAVLAGCDVFLGTSLHGNITAFSFGIPHIFGPIGVAKCAGFLDVTGLTRELKLESWSEASERLEMIGSLGRGYFSKRSVAAKQRVHAVFDLLLRSLTGTRELSDRTNAGGLGAPKVAAGASAAWL